MSTTFVHESSYVDDSATIGEGTSIWHFCHVMAGARLGQRCSLGQNVHIAAGVTIGHGVKIQNNVSVYSGVTIEDEVFLGPSCVFTNMLNPRAAVSRREQYEDTLVCRGATIGANATVVCGVRLGRHCFIAAGTVVTRDVADYELVVGTPGRSRGYMSRHGHQLDLAGPGHTAKCPESGFNYLMGEDRQVRCLDCGEDEPLPTDMRLGRVAYRPKSAP